MGKVYLKWRTEAEVENDSDPIVISSKRCLRREERAPSLQGISCAIDSSQHYCDPLSRSNVFAIWRDDYITVCPGAGGDIAGAVPGDDFYVRVFVFAGENCGEKSLQSCLHFYFGLQAGVQKCELVRRISGKGFDHGPHEQFERDHG
jgi:hypothetical protein